MSSSVNETIDHVVPIAQRVLFTAADYSIFVILIAVSLAIGIYIGIVEWSTATTKDFLVGGRKMHPIPVALSLIGGVISALSVLGVSTETYMFGTQLWLNLVGCIWGTVFIIFIILPTLYPLDLISMMEYMILRYNSPALKKMGSLVQIFAAFLYLGLCLYAPSLALMSVTTLSGPSSIFLLGIVCVIYISLGGVKAVIYTDVLQTTLMFFGVAVVVTIVCIDIGGVAKVFEVAYQGDRIEFFNMDFNPTTRHTFWNVQILGFYFIVTAVGVSQAQFQRLTSVSSLKSAQGLCILFLLGVWLLWSLFYFNGLVAYAAYADCDPLKSGLIEKADQIIPFMVADKLSHLPGMSGLFVSAVYGAVLSSVSSSSSAVAALIWEDFLSDWKWFNKTVKLSPIAVTRCLSAMAGLIGIGAAFLIGGLGSTLTQAVFSLMSAFVSPLDGLFVTAILAPWVNEKGAICGFLTALVFNTWLVTGKYVNGAGKPKSLPYSLDGCPSDITSNISWTTTSSSLLFDSEHGFSTLSPALIYNIEETPEAPERDYLAFYDISYCFYGVIGISIVFIVSTIVSILSGLIDPDDIDERLVNRYTLRFYRFLWNRFSTPKKTTSAPRTTNSIAISNEATDTKERGVNNPSYEMDLVH